MADADPAMALDLHWPGLRGRIVLEDARPVLAGLKRVITGWSPEVRPRDPLTRDAPLSTVIRRRGRFRLVSPWLEAPMDRLPAASAACGVIADMAQAFFEQRPGCIALHCGAFEIAGRLVLLAGPARAGKSTLIARLTAERDLRVYGDDVLPVLADGMAFGLGVAPRLRLPLPGRASAPFRAHVERHTQLLDSRYAYLTAPGLAPHGSRARPEVLISLDRRDGGGAHFEAMEPAEAVHTLVVRNMADPGEGEATFDRLVGLARDMVCLRLVYHDLEEAVALLRAGLGGAVLPDPGVVIAPARPMAGVAPEQLPEPAPPADLARRFRRHPRVAVRRIGGDTFLWHAGTRGYFRLNPMAAAIWALLARPERGSDIAAALAGIFPDQPEQAIRADLAVLFGDLVAADLVSLV